jgi:hypothetical protein
VSERIKVRWTFIRSDTVLVISAADKDIYRDVEYVGKLPKVAHGRLYFAVLPSAYTLLRTPDLMRHLTLAELALRSVCFEILSEICFHDFISSFYIFLSYFVLCFTPFTFFAPFAPFTSPSGKRPVRVRSRRSRHLGNSAQKK